MGLERAGLGGDGDLAVEEQRGDVAHAQSRLARFGYDVTVSGILDRSTTQALSAFQRHFRPFCFDGRPDGETRRLLAALIAASPQL